MKKILYLLSFIIFCNYSAHSEEWVDIYSKSGDKLQVALPDGFCDITHTDEGQLMKNQINETLKNISSHAKNFEAKIIYNLCGHVVDYPWGYVFFNNEKLPSSYTQTELNKLESDTYNKSYTSEIKKKVNKSNNINDANIKIKSLGTPELIWEDENVLISHNTRISNTEGGKFVEEITGSSILYSNYALYMYIYELEGSDNILNNAQLLLNAVKLTKSR